MICVNFMLQFLCMCVNEGKYSKISISILLIAIENLCTPNLKELFILKNYLT